MHTIKKRQLAHNRVLARLFSGSLCAFAVLSFSACKPEKPLELLQRERRALEQAKSVEGMLKKQDDAQRRTADEASR